MRLLLDTNVLLLYLVGQIRPSQIGVKRLSSFTAEDFLKVAEWAAEFPRKHVSLPNILTEASNLLGDAKQGFTPGIVALAKYVADLDEEYVPSLEVVGSKEYFVLGLTDAAIYKFADKGVCVISADYHLCSRLRAKNIDARNPLNFR